jgi:hypothetical protein
MKKLITLILLAGSQTAHAQPGFRHHYHHGYYPGYNYGWVAPTIIGGVIGYEIARNQSPVVVQQPVIVQQVPATFYYGQRLYKIAYPGGKAIRPHQRWSQ